MSKCGALRSLQLQLLPRVGSGLSGSGGIDEAVCSFLNLFGLVQVWPAKPVWVCVDASG
jgi:hypothetical protein